MAEPGNAQQTPPEAPQVPEELLRLGGLPPLSLWETIVGLFLFPHLVLISARRGASAKRPLLIFLGTWLLCTLFMAFSLAPGAVNQVGDFADWLGREMGELRRTEQGLAWDRPDDARQTVRFRGFRVDFVADPEPIDLATLTKGKDAWGLWFSSQRLTLWTNQFGGTAKPLFDARSDKPSLNWEKAFPVGSVLPGSQFGTSARAAARWAVPLMLSLTHGISSFLVCVPFLAIFTLMPALLRSSALVGGLRVALSVNLYCAVIPLIIATVYSRVAPVTLNFMTVFVFAFLGYVIWAFSRVKRFLAGV